MKKMYRAGDRLLKARATMMKQKAKHQFTSFPKKQMPQESDSTSRTQQYARTKVKHR